MLTGGSSELGSPLALARIDNQRVAVVAPAPARMLARIGSPPTPEACALAPQPQPQLRAQGLAHIDNLEAAEAYPGAPLAKPLQRVQTPAAERVAPMVLPVSNWLVRPLVQLPSTDSVLARLAVLGGCGEPQRTEAQ